MARLQVGALLVLSGCELVGIISERDYARKVILQGRSSRDTTVREIMTSSLVTVTSAQTVDERLRIVIEKRIRHLPVVDAGRLSVVMLEVIPTKNHDIQGADVTDFSRTLYQPAAAHRLTKKSASASPAGFRSMVPTL